MNRRAGNLSGGMKQKLALSCTLIHTPEVLFLDEPTTGVDPVSRKEFWGLLYDLKRDGVTIIVSTPYMDEAEKCDDVGFIMNGHIIMKGTPKELPGRFSNEILAVYAPGLVKTLRKLIFPDIVRSVKIFGDRVHLTVENAGDAGPEIAAFLTEKGVSGFTIKKNLALYGRSFYGEYGK